MRLFDRDFTKLTVAEKRTLQRIQQAESRQSRDLLPTSRMPEAAGAVRYYRRLFPNNYLDYAELRKVKKLREQLKAFRTTLDSPRATERSVLRFVRREKAYFIVGSILKRHFTFGHHEAFLFCEFPLGTHHKADYLLVGRSSGGYQFVFVELESPRKPSTTRRGDLSSTFMSGIRQTSDWRGWLDSNFPTIASEFRKHLGLEKQPPAEFANYDSSRFHFVVIAGRRGDFKERTYRAQRNTRARDGDLLLHYDNLLDAAETVIGAATY